MHHETEVFHWKEKHFFYHKPVSVMLSVCDAKM